MYVQIKPLLIEMDGPLALNTGFRRGLIHRTVERDAEEFAYIPASSLKGRVRRACEQIARQVGVRVCRAPRPNGMCSTHTQQPCLVCRVFGMPGRGSELHWQDARLIQDYRNTFTGDKVRREAQFYTALDPGQRGRELRPGDKASREAQFYTRTQVQLSRALGIAAPDHLFTSEFAIENLRFESAITGWLDVTPIAGEEATGGYELLLLLAGLQLVDTLGSGSSRGAGHSLIHLPKQVTIGDHATNLEAIFENFDLLNEFDQEVQHGG
jgi:CRISPR/Cas system CSM-associated protein Csm3 (group 7 of RAMP superfamily)